MIPTTSGKLLLLALFGVAVVALVHAQQQQPDNTQPEPKNENAYLPPPPAYIDQKEKNGDLPVPPGAEKSDVKSKTGHEKEAKSKQEQPKTATADKNNNKTGERVEMVHLGDPMFKAGENGDIPSDGKHESVAAQEDHGHLRYKQGDAAPSSSTGAPEPNEEGNGEGEGEGNGEGEKPPTTTQPAATSEKGAASLVPCVAVMLFAIQLVI